MRYFTLYKCDTKLSCHCFVRCSLQYHAIILESQQQHLSQLGLVRLLKQLPDKLPQPGEAVGSELVLLLLLLLLGGQVALPPVELVLAARLQVQVVCKKVKVETVKFEGNLCLTLWKMELSKKQVRPNWSGIHYSVFKSGSWHEFNDLISIFHGFSRYSTLFKFNLIIVLAKKEVEKLRQSVHNQQNL